MEGKKRIQRYILHYSFYLAIRNPDESYELIRSFIRGKEVHNQTTTYAVFSCVDDTIIPRYVVLYVVSYAI